jgi:hypothetical protein
MVTVDCRPIGQQMRTDIVEENNIRPVRSLYAKYLAQAEAWEDLTYFTFLTTINSKGNT